MEVIVIESETFKRMESMFMESLEAMRTQMEFIENSHRDSKINSLGLLNARQVGQITGYNEKTIKLRKAEIGYHTLGKDIKFKPQDVQAWIAKYYRGPKGKRW